MVAVECKCGDEGQTCEGCGKTVALSDCRSDGESVWLCPTCYAEEVAEAARASGEGGK